MAKIWQKYLLIFVCFLMITNGLAENSDTTKIPCLKLNNYKIKGLIRDLIKDGSIRDNDVVLIGFVEENNEHYLDIIFSRKGQVFLLQASGLFHTQKFIGYSKIFNHDCYVFGNKAELFFVKKTYVQVPDYFNWLLSLNQMKWEDFLPSPHFVVDSDGNVEEVTLHITDRGARYKYAKKTFYANNAAELKQGLKIRTKSKSKK